VGVFYQNKQLDCPNGLWLDHEDLIIGAWGPMTNKETFETSRLGTLKRLNLKTKQLSEIGEGIPIANFDGAVSYNGNFYATDWVGGRLLKINKNGKVNVLLSGFKRLADLGINIEDGIIAMPEMSTNKIVFYHLQ
jgi:hypothetical protein